MAKRLTIEDMQRKASERGGSCKSLTYEGQNSDLEWECSLGHKWFAAPGNIYKEYGTWCPTCKSFRGERVCRAYFEAIFNERFPKARPIWLKNKNGHRLELDGYCEKLGIAFEHQGEQHYKKSGFFRTGSKINNVASRDEIKRNLCHTNNVILIEIPSVGILTKIKDLEDVIFNNLFMLNIRTNVSRPISIDWKKTYISGDVKKLEEMIQIASSRGGKLLSKEFKGLKEKYLWQCSSGHIWKAAAADVARGQLGWCAICAKKVRGNIEKLKKVAESKGGKLLSKRYFGANHKSKWECKEGHIFNMTVSKIMNRGQWCPTCGLNSISKKITCVETGITYVSVAQASRDLNLHDCSISAVLTGRYKSTGGLTFKYYKP